MRVVLAPDSFKGSLSAPDVCAALGRGIARALPDAQILARPMADGGEGTLDAVLAAVGPAGCRRALSVQGAGGGAVEAAYGEIGDGTAATAVIEVAQVVGITDAGAMAVPVADRSTRGVGELIAALLDRGVRRFMIGLGGSSTNDGGSGMLAALGLTLADRDGRPVDATPRALASLAGVDAARVDARLRECEIRIMSDVNNPLCGDLGATAIFGPQKGVTPAEAPAFDATLAHYAALAEAAVGRHAAGLPGAGAAGGLGFALQLVGGTFASGAAVVADLIGLDAALAGADWALTGEGRTDRQTLLAKAPFVVAQRAAAAGVPVTLVSGAIDAASLPELSRHFAGCFALPNGPATLADCIADAAALLEARAEQAARVFAAGRGAAARVGR
ncbi:MAG: glycerate kinase [Betaproteobacteria bacterium]|nr:glycerate kinase [Betaproteobacteria bacterium]